MTGYIKLFRSLKEKGWYKRSDYVHLWLHLLMSANHKENEFMFSGRVVMLKPGQFLTGRKALSQQTGINESKIERILTFFEKIEHQIEQQKSNKNRIITIVSWSDYQITEQQNEQQLNNKRTTTEQQLNTNNNDKNVKNDKNPRSEAVLLKNVDFDFWKKEELNERQYELMIVTKRLHNLLIKVFPENYDIQNATIAEWVNTLRELVEKRKYTQKTFEKVINWAIQDDFYKKNMMDINFIAKNFEKMKSRCTLN